MAENKLYYGDNLDVMRHHLDNEAFDLVYLDPPFKSSKSYNILFKEQNGSRAASQVRAFDDTWTWNQESEALLNQSAKQELFPDSRDQSDHKQVKQQTPEIFGSKI